ncbi:hypothetical protein MTO96_020883 [Rhipicephalus appendiculatus]
MPNSQANTSTQHPTPRHKPPTEEQSNSQASCPSQQATPRHKLPTEERKKEKTAKKTKSKENRQERSEDSSQSGNKRRIPTVMANISWFCTEEEKDKDNTRAARTAEEQHGPKDSWEDPSDDEEHRGEEDPQHQQKLTDDYPPLQQDGKQQEKPSLLTKLARADRAIMKALIKITTATGHYEEIDETTEVGTPMHQRSTQVQTQDNLEPVISPDATVDMETTETAPVKRRLNEGDAASQQRPTQEDQGQWRVAGPKKPRGAGRLRSSSLSRGGDGTTP